MNDFFKDLFQYSYAMNKQVIEEFLKNQNAFSNKAADLLNHILNAQQIWNSRILASTETTGVWEKIPADRLLSINEQNLQNSLGILSQFDLSALVVYKTSKGLEFSNTVRDILFHVVNHSTYHRAQIASEMKQAGLSPLATDYIFYKR